MDGWVDPLVSNHGTGLELQIEEWIVCRERARREGWVEEVHAAELEIAALEMELADLVDETSRAATWRPIIIRGAGVAGQVTRQPKMA